MFHEFSPLQDSQFLDLLSVNSHTCWSYYQCLQAIFQDTYSRAFKKIYVIEIPVIKISASMRKKWLRARVFQTHNVIFPAGFSKIEVYLIDASLFLSLQAKNAEDYVLHYLIEYSCTGVNKSNCLSTLMTVHRETECVLKKQWCNRNTIFKMQNCFFPRQFLYIN